MPKRPQPKKTSKSPSATKPAPKKSKAVKPGSAGKETIKKETIEDVVEKNRHILDGLHLPAASELKTMNLFKLDKLTKQALRAMDDIEMVNFYPMEEILSAYTKKKYDLCDVRNRRVQKAAFSSPKWKSYVRDVSVIKLDWHSFPIEKKKITLNPPYDVAEKALKKVFEYHLRSDYGHDTLVELASSGAIKKLVFWETTDREIFFEDVMAQSTRKREGGAPPYSANLFEAGTVATQPSGEKYAVENFRKAKRWVRLA
jgi:hypothetical protein